MKERTRMAKDTIKMVERRACMVKSKLCLPDASRISQEIYFFPPLVLSGAGQL